MGYSNYFKRGISFFKRNGFRQTILKGMERLARDREDAGYSPDHADEETIRSQKEHRFNNPYKFSILVPVHETDPVIFRTMLDSVGDQTYGNWELILADSSADEQRRGIVLEFTEEYNMKCRDEFGGIHDKVRYIRTAGAGGISANTNEALSRAGGDYIALLDHDDVLENTALFDIMDAIEKKEMSGHEADTLSRAMLVYTDEDKIDETGRVYFDPHIKPDFDPVLLCTNNYICHFLAVRADLAKSVGGFRPEYDGAQDHDFILRCTENIRRDEILHLPKVLYHWRSTKGSTSENPEAKLYAYEAGRSAVKDHLERRGIAAAVTDSVHLGFFDIRYERFPGTVEKVRPDQLRELAEGYEGSGRPEYVLVLSDDLEPKDHEFMDDMLSAMCIDSVGAVTGKIIGRNRKIESAGFKVCKSGKTKPSFAGLSRHFSGYMHRASIDSITSGFSQECVLLRTDAVASFYPKAELKDGYDIYYMHRAVFRRRAR